MNPDRLVVRLAAVAALNNFLRAPFPTLAGGMIFDSRIQPMEDFKTKKVFPFCIVYTDYDRDHWEHHTVNVKTDRLLTVTFELLVAQVTELPHDEGFVVSQPNTDSELETTLDIFEYQVAKAFKADNAAADCWRHLMVSYVNVISRRGATVEGGSKLAARQITVEAKMPRGPANGALAPAVAHFLDELEKHEEYQERVPVIREMYQSAASLSHAEQLLQTMGWTSEAGHLIGYERGPEVLLPDDIVYVDQSGDPLP